MEGTLKECLIRVREDLSKLKKMREILDRNPPEENSKFARRKIEPLNSILSMCSSQSTPETDALETLLDNIHHLVRSNEDPDVWTTFGYELGMICAKILSAIERTEMFEDSFFKLLTIISEISENNSDVWKTTARQILNIFINKKFSSGYFETILRRYTLTLKNVDELVLYNFYLQNLHLLKTLSMLVQRVGDFETQFAVMKVVFLHTLNDLKLMSDFFAVTDEDKALFQSLTFADFEEDCRVYLNFLNKPRGGFERKVYSIGCHVLYLGGCFVKPLAGQKVIWVDANKETERVSFKCAGFESDNQTVIHLKFTEITNIQIKNGKTEGNCCITIQAKNLRHLHNDTENDDLCLVAESKKDVSEFFGFLKSSIKKKKEKCPKRKKRFMERSLVSGEDLQVNAISSSARPEVDTILPDIIKLFGKPDEEIVPQTQIKSSPLSTQEIKIILETQNSPSFLGSLEGKRTFQDSMDTVKFSHKLMDSQEKFFLDPVEERTSLVVMKENKPPSKRKVYGRKTKTSEPNSSDQRVLRERKQPEATSQDCFRQNIQNKKPSLPKFNRKKIKKKQPEVENKKLVKRRRYKPLLIQGGMEQQKPSLLDPNGYGFQRWMQPTTSERSNFWLRKLDEQNKPKVDVFDFSDSNSDTMKKSKKKIVHSKRRYRKQRYDSSLPQVKQVKEILKNLKKPSLEVKKPSPVEELKPVNSPPKISPKWSERIPSPVLTRRVSTPDTSSEDKPCGNQKRDRSEEENSMTRMHFKKKTKSIPYLLERTISRRIQKAETKARQQTDEIIATMNKATNQLLNYIHRKEGMKITTYLNVAEETSRRLETDVKALHQRGARLDKVILCFKRGCSASKLHQSMQSHFDDIRNAVKDMENKADEERKIKKVTDRLKDLIKSEIDKSIQSELAFKQSQLLRCASLFEADNSFT